MERLAGGSEFVSVEDNTIEVDSVNDAVDAQALALLLFAVIAAAAGLVGVGTAVTRQLAASGAEGVEAGAKRPELEELGFDFESTGAPARVANLDEVDGFPQALAAFLAILGLVSVGHALVTSPRRRRRELAVLRTLGLVRRQVGATLAVQATAVTAVGLLVGLPIGVAGGRTLWSMVATGMSVVSRPVVPPSVLLVAPVALVVANLLAVLPARRAAGIRPAEIFGAE